uniref:Uncharacterized protein n=1 Tax=Anopheles dirus TaxID=7168 RepID=A0A182NGZ9_9DIPT
MHPTCLLCVAVALTLGIWLQPTGASFLQANTNPAVKEFGVADAALVLCFDKTVYSLGRSPVSLAHITDKNINYVRVETLQPGYKGGVDAEITGGAIKKPNIIVTLTEGGKKSLFKSNLPFVRSNMGSRSGRGVVVLVAVLLIGWRPAAGNLGGNQNLIVQFGTYDAMLQECFYQKLYSGMVSPQSVTFNNPAAKAIKYIIVVSDQKIDHGGISAAITMGMIDSTAITVQVNASPQSIKFINNMTVRMFCAK